MGGELLGTASSAGSALTACPTLPFTFVLFYYRLTRTLSNSSSVISCAQGQGCLSRCVLVPSAMHPDEVFGAACCAWPVGLAGPGSSWRAPALVSAGAPSSA